MQTFLLIWIAAAAFGLLEALYSLLGGFAFSRLLGEAAGRRPSQFAPPATLIVPCRGIDPGLESNLDAFFRQDYPDFQVLLVVDRESDPCIPVLRRTAERFRDVRCRILQAGWAAGRGQKVHNLLHAVRHLRPRDEAIVFGDSDIRPGRRWLRDLVELLEDPETGVSTGFRWYLPQKGGFASVLRSVWNAGAVSLMKEGDNFFAWGGAMAMRREVFESCRVARRWENALSDDLTASQAVHDCGLSIGFQPRALSFSHEDCNFDEFLEWSGRQMTILRVYHPRLWGLSLAAHAVNSTVFWGGAAALAASWTSGVSGALWAAGASLWAAVYLLGAWKGWLRARAVIGLFPERASVIRRHLGAYVFWGPLASLCSLAALARSVFSREIAWRGIRYRMHGPDRTEVIEE